jgi:hypothetical protein
VVILLSDKKQVLEEQRIVILFLAADPSDATRLRLGQELREIRERLQLSKYRERFVLDSRESARPGDMSQAILDLEPDILHFSGHGNSKGELCLENLQGEIHAVSSDALADLFELVANQVKCVVLNACYSETQAKAVSKHIRFVIGMKEAIGDNAAITFSNGFYKAVGANCSIHKAYRFGCAEIRLQGISEHLTPVFYGKPDEELNQVQVRYELILNATLDSVDESLLNEIIKRLRLISEDASITLRTVKVGSVVLVIEGSPDGFELLENLFASGAIAEIVGLSIQALNLIGTEKAETDIKWHTGLGDLEERDKLNSDQTFKILPPTSENITVVSEIKNFKSTLNLFVKILFWTPAVALSSLVIIGIFFGFEQEAVEFYRGPLKDFIAHPLTGVISSITFILLFPFAVILRSVFQSDD